MNYRESLKRDLQDPYKPLTANEITLLKKILDEQKRNLIFKNCRNDEFNLDQEECSDDVDHANADLTNFQRLRFRTRENYYEKKIDEALKRMEISEYGLCLDCGGPINFARLIARPTAELCFQCKEEEEKDEHFNNIGHRSRSLGEGVSFSTFQ